MAGYFSFMAFGGVIYESGDLNLDGIINILDVVSMVNVVLGNEEQELADLNNDGLVNILDVIILVNTILEN